MRVRSSNNNVKGLVCLDPLRNIYKLRWDFSGGSYEEVELKYKPSKENIQSIIEDYYNKQCNLDNSYVIVYKYSKNAYSYTTYLDCPSYNNKEELDNRKPVIEINMSDDSNNVKKAKADIKITDPNKILSYTITIYKYDEEVYTTGNIEASYETIITKRINIISALFYIDSIN